MTITKVDEFISRGPRPTQDEIRSFSSILCLESGLFEMLTDKVYEEVDICQAFDIKFKGLALNIIFPPTLYQINKALFFMTDAVSLYVHCKAGVDRTGVVVAAYRVSNMGWSADDAIKEMKQMGFHWYYYWWLPSIRKRLRFLEEFHAAPKALEEYDAAQ